MFAQIVRKVTAKEKYKRRKERKEKYEKVNLINKQVPKKLMLNFPLERNVLDIIDCTLLYCDLLHYKRSETIIRNRYWIYILVFV